MVCFQLISHKQFVQTNTSWSAVADLTYRVPQDLILEPPLCLIYINGLNLEPIEKQVNYDLASLQVNT